MYAVPCRYPGCRAQVGPHDVGCGGRRGRLRASVGYTAWDGLGSEGRCSWSHRHLVPAGQKPMEDTTDAPPTGAGSRSLEPAVGVFCDVLARIEPVLAAVDADKLQADRDLMLKLQLAGFTGPPWNRFERDLVSYGNRVLPAMIRKGTIFGAMVKLGLPSAADCRLSPRQQPTPEDADDLSRETMAIALPRYRQSLMEGKWDGSREHARSLHSYFIGRCVLNFRAPWRRWLRAARRLERVVIADPADPRLHADADTDAADAAITHVALQRALAAMKPRSRALLVLDAYDFTDEEIAARMGISSRAVEGQLRRLRERLEGGGNGSGAA